MEILLASVIITFLIMRLHGTVRAEWQHSRDTHATRLSREQPDWSPGRVRRNARRRARGDWLTEIRDGFPSLRATLAEDRVLARTVREEKLAEGEARIRQLRERLAKAVAKREALRRAGDAESPRRVTPEPGDAPVEPGTGEALDAKPGRHVRPEPAAEPEPGTGDGHDPELDAVVHHDHTLVLPGECPQCGGPGPGIPLVRGDRVAEVRAPDGTLIGEGGTVVSADDKTATIELPNGLRVTGPNTAAPLPHRNGDSPDGAPLDAADAEIRAGLSAAGEPLFDGDPMDPRSPAYVEPPDEAALYANDGWPEDNWPDEEAIPNPPSDETTDDTTDQGEGDEMTTTEIDSADTPFHGMQNAFQNYADEATRVAKDAADDLQAQAAIHGFDRDQQAMADIQALTDHAQALAAQATAAKQGLIDRHNAAEEYHGTGQDADASAFRPA